MTGADPGFRRRVTPCHDPKRLNHHVKAPKLGLIRHVYVAPTDAQAVRDCRAAFAAWFDNINFLWAQAGSNRLDFISNFDELLDTGAFIAGSPPSVREQVRREVEESGINYFCCIFAFGNLSRRPRAHRPAEDLCASARRAEGRRLHRHPPWR